MNKNLFTTWISDKPAPDIFYKCFESWHRLMPDWNIKIISLENITKSSYVKERLKEKDYLMAGHWARIWELLKNGGIYVDIDVEAVKRFDDLLVNKFFLGHEGKDPYVNNAIMGGESGHPFLVEMLEYTETFPLTHPEYQNETGPRMVTKLLTSKGWDPTSNSDQLVGDIQVYNSKRFYPYFWDEQFDEKCISPETYSVHHWASTWVKK